MKNSRLTAFEVINGVLRENAYSNLSLEKALDGAENKDKAFVTRLVYGVLERKLTLDYVINIYLKSKTKPKIKILLYMGTYQILFMDKVPDSAAVNETLKLADELGLSFYKKVINAVLRKVCGEKNTVLNNVSLDIKYSCPQSLINMWTKMYGEENTVSILESINNRPPVFAVPNTEFLDAEELQYELLNEGVECELFYECVKINSQFDVSRLNSFKNGLFYIEDYSSYTAACALDAKEGDVVLDMCASPGGKSFTLAQTGAQIHSFDLYEHRVNLISKTAKRLELDNIIAGVNDALVFNPDMPKADKILCDVPCSGFGIIRRKPEIRYKNLDDIKELFDIQYNILLTSSKYLKNGGRIMYSTCTLNKKENEKVVSEFLKNNSEFELIEQRTTFPSKDGGDGFFYALMVKND